MYRLLALILAFIAAPCFAQTNMREINRISDQADPTAGDDIEFFAGESVRLNIFLRRGNTSVPVPTGALPVWKAWVDGSPTPLYINVTGTVVNASLGQLRVELTPSESNATAGTYESQVQLYNSTTYMGVAWSGELEVMYSPASSGLTYVGTTAPWATNITGLADVSDSASPSAGAILYGTSTLWTKLAAGTSGQKLTSGGSGVPSWTADADTLGGLTPTAGRILYGTGSAWATLAAGTSGYVLASQGAAAPIWSAAAGGVSDGDKGDITVSASGATWTVDAGVIGDSKLTTTGAAAGTYPVANVTVNAQGRLTSAATSSSADIQSALGSVYLPLSGGTITGDFYQTGGEFIVRGASATTIALESSAVGSADRGYLDFINDDGDIFSRIVGANTSATRGRMSFRISDNAGTLQTALTLDYDAGASFTGIITGNGSGLTALDATDLVGNIPAESFGALFLEFPGSGFSIATSAQVGYNQYTLTSGSPANAICIPTAAKSANTSEQAFIWRSSPQKIPRGWVALATTNALSIEWIADSTTVADIRGIRVVRYVGATATQMYSDTSTLNVTTINTVETDTIDDSAFTSTAFSAGDTVVIEITGAIEDSMTMGILRVSLQSE